MLYKHFVLVIYNGEYLVVRSAIIPNLIGQTGEDVWAYFEARVAELFGEDGSLNAVIAMHESAHPGVEVAVGGPEVEFNMPQEMLSL